MTGKGIKNKRRRLVTSSDSDSDSYSSCQPSTSAQAMPTRAEARNQENPVARIDGSQYSQSSFHTAAQTLNLEDDSSNDEVDDFYTVQDYDSSNDGDDDSENEEEDSETSDGEDGDSSGGSDDTDEEEEAEQPIDKRYFYTETNFLHRPDVWAVMSEIGLNWHDVYPLHHKNKSAKSLWAFRVADGRRCQIKDCTKNFKANLSVESYINHAKNSHNDLIAAYRTDPVKLAVLQLYKDNKVDDCSLANLVLEQRVYSSQLKLPAVPICTKCGVPKSVVVQTFREHLKVCKGMALPQAHFTPAKQAILSEQHPTSVKQIISSKNKTVQYEDVNLDDADLNMYRSWKTMSTTRKSTVVLLAPKDEANEANFSRLASERGRNLKLSFHEASLPGFDRWEIELSRFKSNDALNNLIQRYKQTAESWIFHAVRSVIHHEEIATPQCIDSFVSMSMYLVELNEEEVHRVIKQAHDAPCPLVCFDLSCTRPPSKFHRKINSATLCNRKASTMGPKSTRFRSIGWSPLTGILHTPQEVFTPGFATRFLASAKRARQTMTYRDRFVYVLLLIRDHDRNTLEVADLPNYFGNNRKRSRKHLYVGKCNIPSAQPYHFEKRSTIGKFQDRGYEIFQLKVYGFSGEEDNCSKQECLEAFIQLVGYIRKKSGLDKGQPTFINKHFENAQALKNFSEDDFMDAIKLGRSNIKFVVKDENEKSGTAVDGLWKAELVLSDAVKCDDNFVKKISSWAKYYI